MVYAAYGVSGLTGIVGTFFVKDHLDLSAEFLAALAFWAGIPWAVKMPVGHVVDLIWRWKALLVWLGAAMIAASLLDHDRPHRALRGDARGDERRALVRARGAARADRLHDPGRGRRRDDRRGGAARRRRTAGRTTRRRARACTPRCRRSAASRSSAASRWSRSATSTCSTAPRRCRRSARPRSTRCVYTFALIIPVLSVLGVVLHGFIKMRAGGALRRAGKSAEEIATLLRCTARIRRIPTGGSSAAAWCSSPSRSRSGSAAAATRRRSSSPARSAIIVFLLWRLARELEPAAREHAGRHRARPVRLPRDAAHRRRHAPGG